MIDRTLQNFLGVDVQMVGRLVQDQKIGIGEHQLGKGNTSSLATAELGDLLEYIVLRKEECSKNIADLGIGHGRIIILQFLKDRLFSVKYLMSLIVVADLYIGSQTHGTAVGLHQIVDDLQNRCFTGAIVSNDGNTFSTL